MDGATEDDLTVGQAADRLRVGTATIRRWIELGRIDAGRTPGGHRRISAASVERLYREMYPWEHTDGDE